MYFQAIFYTLSGKCRVGMRSGCYKAEICIDRFTWAEVDGSVGTFEHAMEMACSLDPLLIWRGK